jgi:sodium-dependent dicarboxylate transporter 2/3/5
MSWWLLVVSTRAPNARLDTSAVQAEMNRSGRLSAPEREIMVVMLICVALWVLGDAVEKWLGLPASLLSSVVVAIGAVAYLSVEELVDWNDMKGVNWGVFLVIGAGFTLGDTLEKTGANEWIASMVQPFLISLSYYIVLLIMMFSTFVLTQLVNSVTLGAILSPLLVAIAQQLGLQPEQLVIPTILVLGFSYLLPSSSSRMTLAYISGGVDRAQMMRSGLVVGVPSIVFLYLFFALLSLLGLF